MSEQPAQKVTFTLRGDDITVTYSPSDGTMDVTMDVERFGHDRIRRQFGGDQIVTTKADFGMLATVPVSEWRDGLVEFLTLAVPNGLPRSGGDANASTGADPSSKASAVKAIAIVSSRRTRGADDPGASLGWTVTALDGTVAVTG